MNRVHGLLSLGDREAHSRSYGCFDRNFWAWKFTDFPGARFQEAVYAISWLYKRENPDNPYTGQRRLLEWAKAAIRFWQGLQHFDGSFDEAYPFEHSLAATAFTAFYVGEAILLLQDTLSEEELASYRGTFRRAGDWLCKNDEHHGVLSNHLAAAAAALVVIERLTQQSKYGARAEYFLDRIYRQQSAEGWYQEYEGADPGYQSHGTFYLARIWQHKKHPQLLSSLTRSVNFIKHFVHPDGTIGGEYGSRNTEFYFPAGFEMLAPACADAATIARFMKPSFEEHRTVGVDSVDSYNFLPLLNNCLFAADNAQQTAEVPREEKLPSQITGSWAFPDAGLLVHSTSAYYAVLGTRKGGVLKAYDRSSGRLAFSSCGYWARLANGSIVSSQAIHPAGEISQPPAQSEIVAQFVRVNQALMTPWLFICFRAFSLTLGRFPALAYWLKRQLVRVLIRRRKLVPLFLRRQIGFYDDHIEINDEIERKGAVSVRDMWAGTKFSTIHMGSARYFQPAELDLPVEESDARIDAEQLMSSGKLSLSYSWKPGKENR